MKKSAAVLALLIMGLSPKAFAIDFQDAGFQDAGAQLSQTLDLMERARVAQQIEEDRNRRDAKVKGEQVEEEVKGEIVEFTVTKFEYAKSAVLPEEQLKTLTDGYLNKQITIKDLYKLVGEINKLYAEEGYATCKAYLPPQRVSGGVVKLMLVEGRTGDIKVQFPNGRKTTRESYVTRRITKIKSGEIMDADDLNKQIVYFNATNDAQLRVVLQPGEKNGTTDFVINVYEPQKYNHTFFTDNAGNESTGYYRAGYFMNVKSLTGNRDSLTIGGVYSKGSFMWSASYDTPISKSGTKLSFGYSGNATEIDDMKFYESNVNTKGHSTAYTMALRQPWVVNETTRSEVGLEFAHQSSDTTISDSIKWIDDLVRDLNVYFSHTSYGKSHFFYQKHSYAAYGNNYSSGMASNNDVSNMHYYKLNTYYQKAYQHRQAINIRFDAQKTWNDKLPSSREFFAGGMNSVRGYKESSVSGYSGYLISAEYQVPVSKDFRHNAFVFHDYANVSDDTFSDRVLQSVGVGIKSNWSKHIYSTLTAGFPLRRDLNKDHVSGVRINYMISGTF